MLCHLLAFSSGALVCGALVPVVDPKCVVAVVLLLG